MKYNINKDFLPVGTVVKIRFDLSEFVIIGYKIVEAGTKKVYDYAAVEYPYGYVGNEKVAMFNKDIIKKVVNIGYVCKKEVEFVEYLNKQIEDGKIIEYEE